MEIDMSMYIHRVVFFKGKGILIWSKASCFRMGKEKKERFLSEYKKESYRFMGKEF